MFEEICLGGLLLICTFTDIKNRVVSMWVLSFFAGIGVFYQIFLKREQIIIILLGMSIGFLAIIFSKLTKALGMGDAYLLIVCGIYLGFYGNLDLFAGAILSSAVYAGFLLMFKKAGRKKEIPFVPFFLLSFIRMVIF